ncbi:hypothetical protein [Mesorhizobium sp.]|uniref:hypothetical protein n=1 Tax=Mesorhizobium sp. TaxID=1871066 RepID=UPI00120ED1C8|nr:hypothetical protein [Mesorhizobium sp.]TIO05688.1 MAG: hypothetical protein E5X88_25725 [Mesorhizobium sp.]TIO33083.1 MAG: hypothetical protein E5X89_17045 [Mesorhizobium sp.]
MRKWWRQLTIAGVILFILAGIAGGPLGDIGSAITFWFRSHFSAPQRLTIDFNDVQGCLQGKLADIAKRQMDGVGLTNGADSLTICDNQPLNAVRSELPRALANRIPGCLNWRSWEAGGLVLVRKSDAVCALPGGKRFVCDGPNGRHALGNNAVGDSMDRITPCSDDLLRRFGFSS